ncbi:molybdenum ABC transporter ATP-binding protein [Aliiglaciecola sp. LCG003]|uniref:molybdenum ABC transporter ATP-binding protein n=1 Tax=Aliiglaciecola sp. LCG003 TaxID=3053655 RepID=UPI002572317F|nr:molybdenum ABC transporter ATP-binding protein [Aliiglaciecola sp. LCG003]WJG10911.1 molybdenum ABC transporter ATP-binding protein [Aliiglaciecola sp. LCG003]
MSIAVSFTKHLSSHTLEIDVNITENGVTAIFGPSGVGKTTLLRVIAGLEAVSNGRVRFGSQVWQQQSQLMPTHLRQVAMVFQQPSLFAHLNVENNIFYAKQINPQKFAQLNFNLQRLIDIFQLQPLLKRMPNSLSGGEQQRVAIVRALASQPKVLLMDEPLASLDDGLKQQFIGYFETLLEQINIPVIYVTHSKEEVARLSTHLIMLDKGDVVAQGKTADISTDLLLPLANASDAKCCVQGTISQHLPQQHLSQLNTSIGELYVAMLAAPCHNKVSVLIFAKDVSITLSHQQDTSILNILGATIVDFSFTEPGKVTVKLAIQGTYLLSQITRKSFDDLALTAGMNVFAQIKSIALG